MCNNILYFDDFNPWQNTGGATEMLMEKLLGNISRQLCSQTELNVKPYIPQYPLEQKSNNKIHPFPHNSLTPKYWLKVRKWENWPSGLLLSERVHCYVIARNHLALNPLMWWGPFHTNSVHIKWAPSSQMLIDHYFIMNKSLP